MKLIIQGMLISLSWTFQSSAVADEPYAPLREEALKIIRTEFPDAAFTKDAEGQYEFKTKTRSFTIYRLDKTGNWQKPSEAEAPDRGGIRVRFFVSKKPWEGALVVPYSGTKDFHVFQVTHVIKNSADGKCHIWAEILTGFGDTAMVQVGAPFDPIYIDDRERRGIVMPVANQDPTGGSVTLAEIAARAT